MNMVKGFRVVNEAEVDIFLELPCFLHDPTNVGNLISVSSASLKPILYIWKFLVHVLLKPSLKDFEHLASMWNEHNCKVVFFGIVLLWDWNENWPFPVPWSLLSFPSVHFQYTMFHCMVKLQLTCEFSSKNAYLDVSSTYEEPQRIFSVCVLFVHMGDFLKEWNC